MIERVKHTDDKPATVEERVTVLDDRLLHLTRDEAKAHLDEYLRLRGIISESDAEHDPLP